MRSYAQYGVLFELALVDVDEFPNCFLGRFIVGMKQLQHVRILSNDFAVGPRHWPDARVEVRP